MSGCVRCAHPQNTGGYINYTCNSHALSEYKTATITPDDVLFARTNSSWMHACTLPMFGRYKCSWVCVCDSVCMFIPPCFNFNSTVCSASPFPFLPCVVVCARHAVDYAKVQHGTNTTLQHTTNETKTVAAQKRVTPFSTTHNTAFIQIDTRTHTHTIHNFRDGVVGQLKIPNLPRSTYRGWKHARTLQ